ncbi:hypothetical protein GCM10011584_22340 [Nocardioides phosphati]|uniref:DUF11 domain-containing protein n=1 Tax=Nocardioides phosphati TaxID=1867775 RepID=A0ABQ2NDC9_9ACTN|nr:hypothetical protein [Nocardioides phosphati]GGO90478.1 hypothetical protein GCM10011584_22340 [Nocardioides phosphati]
MSKQPRASRISEWQPIGLATPLTTNDDPRLFVHDLSVARARRTARSLIAPGVVLAATLGIASTAAATGMTATTTSQPTMSTTSTTTTTSTSTSTGGTATSGGGTTTTTGSTSSPLSGLGGGELPGSNLPVMGKFIANAPKIFSGGLLAGKDGVQTSVPRPEHTAHSQGGDACDFFLEHMWKNEDGIPVIGTNTHFLTYHTDAEYKNLILSLASGSIGNSQMPIVDLYGGPLGWIPIFNPKHVEGHGTDYATMLTGCGGMGLPVDIKTGAVNLDRLPTPDKVMTFAKRVVPDVPNPQKILGPDYLYNTLAVDEITDRLGFNTVFTPDEYLNFATNNADAFRTLGTTAFEPLASGDPTKLLEVLQVTDNIKTLESLGMPGFSSLLGPLVPQAGTTQTVTIDGKTYPVRNGKVTTDEGMVYTAQGGSVTVDGKQYPVKDAPTSGGLTGSLPTGDLPVVSDLLKGGQSDGSAPSSPLGGIPVLGGLLGGSASTPTSGGTGSTPTTGGTSSSTSPLAGLPVIGDLLGDSTSPTGGTTTPTAGTSAPTSKSPLAGLPVVGDLLGGALPGGSSSTPTGGSSTPTGGSTTPTGGSTNPTGGTTTPTGGSTTPTGGSTNPTGGTTPTTGGTTGSGSTSPASGLPVVGDLLGGSSPLSALPAVGSVLGGSTTPTGGTTTPTGGTTTPTGGTTPTTSGNSPSETPHGTVAFTIAAPKVNGQSSPNAPGVTIPTGHQVTFTVPVTNTGDVPLTTLVGKASDGGTMTGARLPLAPGQTTTLTYTTTAKPGTQALSFGIVGSNPNGQQQGKTCSAVYTGDVQNGEIATTGALEVDDQPTNDAVRYTFHSTDVSKLDVQVTNHGDAPLQNITATSPTGPVTGGKTTLQPGESTWYSIQIAPKSGINTVPVTFTGTDPTGKVTTAQERFEYTLCTCAATTAPSQA